MAQLITVRLNKSDQQPLGFRLQGGKDFGTPLVVQKVNGGSAAERAGLQAGDALIRVNSTDVYTLRHQEAQDTIRAAGQALELTIQRGGGTWRPSVTPTGSLPRPGSRPLGSNPTTVTNTSLKANQQPSRAFGSGHNNVAKPFGYMNGTDSVKGIVNKQYNTPVNMYSDKTIAETLSAQSEVLAGGVLGVNFKKNEKTYDAEKSAVFKVLQEAENDPEPPSEHNWHKAEPASIPSTPVTTGLRHVPAPVTKPDAPLNNTGGLPVGQNICEDCERLITGVFVRIKDKNLHVECFKCATCGTSLKNQGYYNLNGKLYCDIHAKLVARQNPPASNLEPVTVPPGGRVPSNTYSTPLPPLSTGNYTNGSSSLFSPSSNLSGPKPFGSSIGSAYSPSLSPRSAPMSPARPTGAPPAPITTAPLSSSFAPTNEAHIPSPHRMEYKSPAEERLIRKMAKMALNGYEIGIQRKIKPAEHIQSMADRIQDTVVTKHPLNADTPPIECSRENTIKRSPIKLVDKESKYADSIPNSSLLISQTLAAQAGKASNSQDYAPLPPPLPTTPVPTFIVNTNLTNGNMTPNSKHNAEKVFNGNGYLNREEENGYRGAIDINSPNYEVKYKMGSPKSYKEEINTSSNNICNDDIKYNTYSNTQNKKKFFEKKDNFNDFNSSLENRTLNHKFSDDLHERKHQPNTNSSHINVNKPYHTLNGRKLPKNSDSDEDFKSLPNNIHDNSLYTYKPVNKVINNDNHNNFTHVNEAKGNAPHVDKGSENNEIENKSDETIVKRREKKNLRKDDGKRDSHIIARPLSTMTSVDVTDGHYPVCHICDKAITRGPFITALGRIWCPEHFVCVNATCRRPLQDIGFVEENGQLYCEYCFEQYIAPSCDKCHAKIKGDCLNAIGKHFHPECFSCVYCGKLFGNNPFFLEDGLPYCEADWNELFTTKCFACGFPVEAGDRWVEALNNNYHSQCFNCTVCKKNLEGQSFFAKGGRPFCKVHAR
ncbi:PDZ and LIM domain protein Zasp isoform X2 [Leptidea sinapis]|uniref:PDZ and LIM domain protein Zasp isoform X2 n=1 Tax=Leptidea sinapis TaxID=189913 RepID=UPI0021C29939|nr:PDZ and LIM domain protein Zasp isoform X2 [Leptidea sinapis]